MTARRGLQEGCRKAGGVGDWLYRWCYLEGDDAPVEQQQSCADRKDSNEMLGDGALGGGEEKDGAS